MTKNEQLLIVVILLFIFNSFKYSRSFVFLSLDYSIEV